MTEAVIVDAVRTPIGAHSGVLACVHPDDLATQEAFEWYRDNGYL